MKKEFKGFICGVVATVIVAGTASGVGIWDSIDVLKNDISVVVDGNVVTADNFLYNDITYLPLRAVSEALGETVEYDEAANTAYIGERKENNTMKSKYIPSEDLSEFIYKKDSVYYIEPTYILEKAEKKGLNTNIDELIGNDKLNLEIDGKTWYMILIDEWRYMPYDTYVDEIEPLLR